MAVLPLDILQVGMTLKAAVCDRSGRMLLPAGIELEEKHLKIFRTWGVSEADIEGDSEDAETTDDILSLTGDPVVIAAAQNEVERLFMHNDPQHLMIHELMRICVARRVTNAG